MNYRKLREAGARSRPGDVRKALQNVSAEQIAATVTADWTRDLSAAVDIAVSVTRSKVAGDAVAQESSEGPWHAVPGRMPQATKSAGNRAARCSVMRAASYDAAMTQAVIGFHLPDWASKRLLVIRRA